ncbi:hypothetical protein HMI55_007113 [Coelomomyces lativittatus]|nr:hypothetical protein HMI56_000473 [Coelomomyces lativittatus]KAJ1510129.1 hypothetical protein HMI55_007113 [Coelomomyces lativittatus]
MKTPELQFKWLPIPSHYEEPSTLSYCRGIFHATTEALGPSFSQFECSGEASCSSMKSVTFKLQEGFDPGHVFKLGRFYVSCDVHPPKRDEHHPFTRVFDILVEKITKTDLNNLRVLPIKINDRTIFLTSTTFQYTYSMKLETPRLDIQFNPNLVEHHGFKIHKLVGNIHLLPTKPMLTPTSVNVHPHLFFCLETKCSLPFTYLFVNEKNVTLKDPHSLRDQTASLTFSFFFYDGLTHFLTVNYSASMKFD